jgi:hypothetical protein
MKPMKKVTNKRASEYDIVVAFPFLLPQLVNPRKIANQWAFSGVRVANTVTFQQKGPQIMIQFS